MWIPFYCKLHSKWLDPSEKCVIIFCITFAYIFLIPKKYKIKHEPVSFILSVSVTNLINSYRKLVRKFYMFAYDFQMIHI